MRHYALDRTLQCV